MAIFADTRHGVSFVAVAVLTSLASATVACSQQPAEAPTIAEFNTRVEAYLEVQKRLTAGLPPLVKSDDPFEIAARETAFGEAVRAGRAGVPPGDILTPNVAAYFRRVIKRDFRSRTEPEQLLMLDEIPQFHPTVNQTYPHESPLATFPASLLTVLPALPEGLEYRLLSKALIIRDVKGNIIADFILDVF